VPGSELSRVKAVCNIALWLLLSVKIGGCLQATPASAQATRTYVSGTGNDTAACTMAAPCQTLQAALAMTAPGGEIYALNSANYGHVTVTKAVSIIGGQGTAGVLTPSSISGITINAGPSDVVNLRGLDIDGAGSGTSGIVFTTGGSLNVQNSVIRGFTSHGISFQPTGSSALYVADTLVANNANTGIMFQSMSPANSIVVLNDVQAITNGTGIAATGTSSTAVLTLKNSVVANNIGVGALSGGLSAISITNSTFANNGVGLSAQNAGAVLYAAQSTVTGNGMGWQATNGGQVVSASNNAIGGNASGNNAPPTSLASPPPPPPPPVANYLLDGVGGYILDSNGARITAL
jgi:hypothetical protein